MQSGPAQLSLFGHEDPDFDPSISNLERIELTHGAWIDLARGWLEGHARLFDRLARTLPWRSDERVMYEKLVDVPRLYCASLPKTNELPVLSKMRAALDEKYATSFERLTFAYYRDGRDSVAWHGDYVARRMHQALVATVSVGAPRRFFLRPKGGGRSISFPLGWGDLIVMGGTCQRTWEHAIPKVAHAEPRIAIMYRPVWRDDGSDVDEKVDR